MTASTSIVGDTGLMIPARHFPAPNIRLFGPIQSPGKRACSSTAHSRRASSACGSTRATQSLRCSIATSRRPSSASASSGSRTRLHSGTTVASSIRRYGITTPTSDTAIASRSAATSRTDALFKPAGIARAVYAKMTVQGRCAMRKRNLVAAISSFVFAGIGTAAGQVYPSRPITVVVPFAAGGPTDTVARIVTEPMRASLGQAVTIENITGAAGTVGTGRVAHAAPDGYTLVAGYWGTHVLNGALYTLKYDVLRDFEPIALLASNPQLIVAKNAVPANDLNELIAWLKANPNKA